MSDVVILGGGVIGMICARQFAASGANVTVVDRQKCGQESSWAGGGILSPLYPWRQADAISHLARQSQTMYTLLAAELQEDTGIDPELMPSGLLVHAPEDLDTAMAWCKKFESRVEIISAEDLSARCKPCNPAPQNSLWFPEISHIRNPRLLKALKADLHRRGVRVIEERPVTGLLQSSGRVISVSTAQGNIEGDMFIAATGAWSSSLLSEIAPSVQVSPVQGQMLLYDTEPGFLPLMILSQGQYLIPRKDGRILVGSTVSQRGFDKQPDLSARQQLARFAGDLCPALREQEPSHHWAGLRPGTENGIPYIDIHPELENLAINCGHFRNGLVMAPASAAMTMNLLLKQPPGIDPAPFRLEAMH